MDLWARCANVGGAGANPTGAGRCCNHRTKGHPSMTQLQARTSVRMDRAEEAIAAIVGHMQEHDITVRREGSRWVADYEGGQGQLWLEGRQVHAEVAADRKSTRLNSSHLVISYAVFCLKTKNKTTCCSAVSAPPYAEMHHSVATATTTQTATRTASSRRTYRDSRRDTSQYRIDHHNRLV